MRPMSDWSCGIHRLPAVIEGDPPMPVTVTLWMEHGFVRSFDLYQSPTEPLDGIAASFERAVMSPIAGVPGRPERVHVASEPLARKLTSACGVEVIVGEIPDIEHALGTLGQFLGGPPPTALENLQVMPSVHLEQFLRVAFELFTEKPWEHCPPDVLFGVRVPSLGLERGVVTIMGHNMETLGFMLFKSEADFSTFVKLVGANELDAEMLPVCFSLSCELQGAGDDPEMDVPMPVPEATVFDRCGQRPPAESELRLLIACTIGLTKFFRRRGGSAALDAAWHGGKSVRGRYTVNALGQKHLVYIQAPVPS